MEELSSIPLVITFEQVVIGDGFLAGVRMKGRALLEQVEHEDGTDEWITGVTPVGIGGGGANRDAAFTQFRNAWVATLFDIAAEAKSFAAFESACSDFLSSSQDSITSLWVDAVQAVRHQGYEDKSLRREDAAKHEDCFKVVELQHAQAQATANRVETAPRLAA